MWRNPCRSYQLSRSLKKPTESFWWKRRRGLRTLIVIEDISLVIPAAIVSFTDTHGVMREVDITVIAFQEGKEAEGISV